jgi:cytochrome c peroxidase
MTLRVALFSLLVLVALTSCSQPPQSTVPAAVAARQIAARQPISPIPPSVEVDGRRVALGSALFHDPRLSHDDTISCASCHNLATGGVDGTARSRGIDGQLGGRNAPSVFNSGLNFRQFWDGRAATLEDQIDGPITNPLEMASNWPEITRKLSAAPDMVTQFGALYSDGITTAGIKDALATFERSLNTPNSRFDRFLRGDTAALTPYEVEGYETFKSFGCVSCHQGANVGGNMYQRFGVMEQPASSNLLMLDLGRFELSADESDKHVFRVPSLRNVAVTGPYFHDGSVASLEGAVVIMGRYQLGRSLTRPEVDLLTAFLKTLTGEYQGHVLR